MQSPGESLRQERESRGKTIEEMAEATGIRLHLLTALEQEAFDSLPGRGFGKLYIRAYAEVLGFDPRPVIEAYDRAIQERQAAEPTPETASAPRPIKTALARWRQELIAGRAEAELSGEPEEETFDEPEVVEQELEPVPAPPEPRPVAMEPAVRTVPLHVEVVSPSPPARTRRWPVASLLLLVLLPLMAYLVFSRSKPDPPPVATRHEPVPAKAMAPPSSLPPPPEAAEAARTPPRTQMPVPEPAAPSSLTVAESLVGLRLVGTRLEGEGDRFRSGQRVTFATRVLGGGAGESIHHVWLRDGRVEQSIRLRLGGATWRTYSTKTLGRPGVWAVEARDEQGRVLARADFTVTP
ncbi:MAG TPA: DUF2914 domain-containing protein [Candidatus Polarisedimenticolia bacterium]|jgi:cytoskeleton protein RodZ|nr:DUF2914 domain-containing protein [Candidatus Polarisedimenticolia bacterium]